MAGLDHVQGGVGARTSQLWEQREDWVGPLGLSPDTREQGWWPLRGRSKLRVGSLGEEREEASRLSSLGVEGIRAPWGEMDEVGRGSGGRRALQLWHWS